MTLSLHGGELGKKKEKKKEKARIKLLACGRWYKNGASDMIIYSSVKSILGSAYPAFLFDNYEQLKQNLKH